MNKKMLVTTSWDDGHMLDMRTADLLDRYDLRGTFYISQHTFKTQSISEEDIRSLSKRHEIGGHSLRHPDLTKLTPENASAEIQAGKQWLESLIGKKLSMFCYPYGFYNKDIVPLVKESGFDGARTTKTFHFELPEHPYEMHTSIHVYPFPFRKKNKTEYLWGRHILQPFAKNIGKIVSSGIPPTAWGSFPSLAKAAFEKALWDGGCLHLWGHSWEVEKYGMWNELEDVFRFIANRKDLFISRTNGEVLCASEEKEII